MLKDGSPLDAGWARRLCSGSLLQFVTREDFYENDIPSLGFYGHREFVLQNYSCPASPFIMFLPFIVPGAAGRFAFLDGEGKRRHLGGTRQRIEATVLAKPGLVLVNHGRTGTSEIISGKVYDDDHNYSKAGVQHAFPVGGSQPAKAARPGIQFPQSGSARPARRRHQLLPHRAEKWTTTPRKNARVYTTSQSMLYNGVRDGVLYRQVIMRKPPNNGVGYIIDLAEITIPGGVIRVDRCRLAFEHELTLGHYGLPHMDGKQPWWSHSRMSARSGITAAIPGRKVALIAYHGWDRLDNLVGSGRNAEADESTVLYATVNEWPRTRPWN